MGRKTGHMVKRRIKEMKKLFTLFAAALVMLAAASCEKNEVLPEGNTAGKVVTLKASINNGETKTSLGEKDANDKYPVLWSEGDAIAVIQTNGVGQGQAARIFKFVLKEGDGGKTSGEFELEISENCGYTAADFNASEEIIAFYPFEDVHYSGINGENQFNITYNIPDVQVYATNTFEKGASPMVAYRATDANGTLSFQNLFGVLKLQLQGANEKVQSIEIISSTYIAGDETGLTTSNKESLQFEYRFGSLDGRKRVTLDCGNDGVSINNLTTFMIALHPDATDLEVRIHTDKELYCKIIPTSDANDTPINDIIAGNILAMQELNTANMAPAYIDETDVYQGDGVALPDGNGGSIIWAPVNCGYEAPIVEEGTTISKGYPYGKLYQWGRKYGQGYNSTYDATTPEISTGPVTLDVGQSESNMNVLFHNSKDWLSSENDKLWNSGTEESPVKTDYDPCPKGWRVPTKGELSNLRQNYSSCTTNAAGQQGFWFSGATSYTQEAPQVFFPAAGYHHWQANPGQNRDDVGRYWSSSPAYVTDIYVWHLDFNRGSMVTPEGVEMDYDRPGYGFSVRCVKDTPQSEPMPSGN